MTDTPESVATSLAAPKRGSWGRKSCPRWSLRSLPAAQLSSEISPCWAERGLGLRPSPEIMFELPMWRKGPDGHDNPSIFKRSGRKFQVTLGRNSSGLQPGVCSSSCQQGQPRSAAEFSSSQKACGGGTPAPHLLPNPRLGGPAALQVQPKTWAARSELLAMTITTTFIVCLTCTLSHSQRSQESAVVVPQTCQREANCLGRHPGEVRLELGPGQLGES